MIAVIDDLVAQYAEQTAFLSTQRVRAARSAVHDLAALAELDERLAAHLEGLHVSGAAGWRHALDALHERPEAGEAFTAAVLALEIGDSKGLEAVLAVAELAPRSAAGIASAFGWVDPSCLRGIVADLLHCPSEVRRLIGVSACARHRVDPRDTWTELLCDPSVLVRARTLRLAGEVGTLDRKEACLARLAEDSDAGCRLWAAWSAVLLGDRGAGLDGLMQAAALRPGGPAFELALQVLPPADAHAWLKHLAGQGTDLRTLLRGSGHVGDPAYAPWLLSQMAQPAVARLAGESFSLITGADLHDRTLNGTSPTDFEAGPTDDPDDPDVEMDPDADLPWPGVEAVSQWWAEHREGLPVGVRLLLGAPITREHLVAVLETRRQGPRALAARALVLIDPGLPLFDIEAPASRQQVALASISRP